MEEKIGESLVTISEASGIVLLQQKVNTLMRENEEINQYLEVLEKRIQLYWNTFRVIGVVVLLDFLIMLWHISK